MPRTTQRSDYPSYDNKWGEPRRTIRIADQLWIDAGVAAAQNGENVTQVIRRALQEYVDATNANDTSVKTAVREVAEVDKYEPGSEELAEHLEMVFAAVQAARLACSRNVRGLD